METNDWQKSLKCCVSKVANDLVSGEKTSRLQHKPFKLSRELARNPLVIEWKAAQEQ